ncbi:MAG: histidine kinase [Aurantimonas endophytica]|uniref:histidine kinase n=1 Tax=Aurantimonas endophytica TaxID=1522175 RepID=UPI0030026CA3
MTTQSANSLGKLVTKAFDEAAMADFQDSAGRKPRATLQRRIAIGLALVSITAWIALAVVMIVNARVATTREVQASFFIAERFVRERLHAIEASSTPADDLSVLRAQIEQIRHVRVDMNFSDGREIPVASLDGTLPDTESDADGASPAFFTRLIQSTDIHAIIPVAVRNERHFAEILLRSDDTDEIEEVWEDFRFVLPMTMIYGGLISLVAMLYVNTVFRRLRETSSGLLRLKEGHLDTRLPEAGFAEFAPVASGFNELAASLMNKTTSNQHLANRLLTAHDEERRRVANELHDEIGPNLFAVRAALSDLKRAVGDQGPEVLEQIESPLGSLEKGIADVQLLLRRILSKLKPMVIGSVPLVRAVDNLATEFRRLAPYPTIEVHSNTDDLTFGMTVDLTIHRFVAEAILNALRHGKATEIVATIDLEEEDGKGRTLIASVTDNGHGLGEDQARGIGLSGLHERVETLGGQVFGPERQDDRTVIVIRVPAPPGQHARMTPFL